MAQAQTIVSSLGLSQCLGCIQKALSSSRSQTCKSQVRGPYHELNIFAMALMHMNLCDLFSAVACELIKQI